MKALIFDMDGTLTEPRKLISDEMIEVLRKVPNSYKKYLVTGSDMAKVEEQIPVEFLLTFFDKVFACNGTRVFNTNLDLDDESKPAEPELVHKVNLIDFYSEADLNHIVNTLLKLAHETHTKIKTGTFVEWRESQINFSVVGRNCTSLQREDYVKWDNKSKERKKLVEQLENKFQGWGLSFRLGGQISIDVTRQGWDKSYAFDNIAEKPEDCVYFGDKIVPGGNDFDIAVLCGKYHDIQHVADTILALNNEYVP
jgi:phosphomannomutase|tara:strand:+ start:2032 stop:2793 length:762 start_codon:yes stop_codon:yes gene_type:complete